MGERHISEEEVFRFILNQIDTVPHLEALLLLWSSRPLRWTEDNLAAKLYVDATVTKGILQDLMKRRLIGGGAESEQAYWYESPSEETDRLMEAVAEIYRRELVRVSTFIHLKASSGVREFARAFKFTRERE